MNATSLKMQVGNFLYKNAYGAYRPLYTWFKARQDAFEIQVLRDNLRQGDVVLDIGANIGFYTRILSELVGSGGRVHCFEPEAENVMHLKNVAKDLANVVVYAKAVGPKDETLTLYVSHRLNVDHRTYKPETYDRGVEMEAVAIDTLFPLGSKIDFIKMDIQGFEMQAVQGMRRTLEQNRNVKILSEFWPYGLKRAGSSAEEYFNFLERMGFSCFLLEKSSLQALSLKKARSLEGLGEEHYFNIFARRI